MMKKLLLPLMLVGLIGNAFSMENIRTSNTFNPNSTNSEVDTRLNAIGSTIKVGLGAFGVYKGYEWLCSIGGAVSSPAKTVLGAVNPLNYITRSTIKPSAAILSIKSLLGCAAVEVLINALCQRLPAKGKLRNNLPMVKRVIQAAIIAYTFISPHMMIPVSSMSWTNQVLYYLFS